MFMIGHFVEYCPQHACPVPRITTRSYTGRLAELNYFSRLKYVHGGGTPPIMDAANLVSEAISILPVSASLKVGSNENES